MSNLPVIKGKLMDGRFITITNMTIKLIKYYQSTKPSLQISVSIHDGDSPITQDLTMSVREIDLASLEVKQEE